VLVAPQELVHPALQLMQISTTLCGILVEMEVRQASIPSLPLAAVVAVEIIEQQEIWVVQEVAEAPLEPVPVVPVIPNRFQVGLDMRITEEPVLHLIEAAVVEVLVERVDPEARDSAKAAQVSRSLGCNLLAVAVDGPMV